MTFAWSKILLSARERRAMFRALKSVRGTQDYVDMHRVETLLDGLDDGGVWNPCFLHLPEEKAEQDIFFFSIAMGKMNHPEFEHHYNNLLDRVKYIGDRERKLGKSRRWPFLTAGDYYGANWRELRQDIITRDGFQCQSCSLTRKAHRDMYGHDLHVHHITPKAEFNSLTAANKSENLTTLCASCHRFANPNYLGR